MVYIIIQMEINMKDNGKMIREYRFKIRLKVVKQLLYYYLIIKYFHANAMSIPMLYNVSVRYLFFFYF